jgi:MFS family permease
MLLSASSNAPIDQSSRAMSLKELINTSPLACFGMLMLGGIYATIYAMSPVYATERGLSVAQTSWFISSILFGAMIFQFPIGWLSDRLDRRLLIVYLTAIGAMVSLVCMHWGDNLIVLMGGAFVIGGTSNPLYSLLVAYANDYLELDQMAAAAGGLLFINGCGAMTGPVIVGYTMSHLGVEWYFITLVLLMSTICLYGVYRMSQRQHTVIDDTAAPYLPISARTTSLATGYAIAAAEDDYLDELEESEEVFESRPHDSTIINRLDDQIDEQDNSAT